jgi:hypothetical protein
MLVASKVHNLGFFRVKIIGGQRAFPKPPGDIDHIKGLTKPTQSTSKLFHQGLSLMDRDMEMRGSPRRVEMM